MNSTTKYNVIHYDKFLLMTESNGLIHCLVFASITSCGKRNQERRNCTKNYEQVKKFSGLFSVNHYEIW